MSITLAYLTDLSRVRIELSGLTEDTVRVERSANEQVWEPVRGGLALPVSGGDAQLDDYEFFPGDTFYRVLDADDLDAGPVEDDDITVNLNEVWLKSIRYPMLNRPVTTTNWSEITRASRSGVFDVQARSTPVAVHDLAGSQQFTLELTTETPLTEAVLDLVLAAGGTMFVHVPVDCPIPGGYVTIGDTARERRSTRAPRRHWALPCRIVTPPAAQIVGGTLTWRTVRRLYGDTWTALWAAHPTFRSLWDEIGDPDDLVVI